MPSENAFLLVALGGSFAVLLVLWFTNRARMRRLEHAPRVAVPCLAPVLPLVGAILGLIVGFTVFVVVVARQLGPAGLWLVAGSIPVLALLTIAGSFWMNDRFARGHVVLDGNELRWSFGAAQGRIALDQPFVFLRRRALGRGNDGNLVQWDFEQGKARLSFFYPAKLSERFDTEEFVGAYGVSLDQRARVLAERAAKSASAQDAAA